MPEGQAENQPEDRALPCPNCGYDMRASFVANDQPCRCPECGVNIEKAYLRDHDWIVWFSKPRLWYLALFGPALALSFSIHQLALLELWLGRGLESPIMWLFAAFSLICPIYYYALLRYAYAKSGRRVDLADESIFFLNTILSLTTWVLLYLSVPPIGS
ncbi:MAG: hypothetical protein O7G85_00300 [Planctomycetota bacterium]|nr:hypothetical protein [Planctomycetota bacterium]